MEALYYRQLENKVVQCTLCPHECKLKSGSIGICKTRYNDNGVMKLAVFGIISSSGLDPIEKKPLYHFFPGSKIYSIGSYGCNMKCSFCQNYEISQYVPDGNSGLKENLPQDIVNKALFLPQNIGIAYTYNEPTVFFELMYPTAKLAKSKNLKNVMVSNGYINPDPLHELIDIIDAFNIDLKAFNNEFYRKQTGGQLAPVLKNLKTIKKNGNHLEISFLVIPNLNDSTHEAIEMFKWINEQLGSDTPLHINRYYPAYKLNEPPTPPEKLIELREYAMQYLKFVYIGNLHFSDIGTNTVCPSCNTTLIERHGYNTKIKMVDSKGYCKICGYGPIVVLS